MNLFDIHEGIIITPRKLKNKLLFQVVNSLKKIKIYDEDEFLSKLTFSYDNETLIFLHKKFNMQVTACHEVIDYLYFINAKTSYTQSPLNLLSNIYQELIENKLLAFNPLFKQYIKDNNIYFYGYFNLNAKCKKIINEVDNLCHVKIIPMVNLNLYKPVVHGFNSLEDEVTYVAQQISELISNGIDINKIYLVNVDSEYFITLKRVFNFYNIPLLLDDNPSLYDMKSGKEFLSLLKEHGPLEALALFKLKYIDNGLDKIINILNKYAFNENYNDCIDFIIEDFKNTKLNKNKLENAIHLITYDEMQNDDNYYFTMSANYGYLPSIKKNEDYLDDSLKEIIKIDTSNTLNHYNKQYLKYIICNYKNIYLSYKLSSIFNKYVPMDLIEELDLKIIFHEELLFLNSFSSQNDSLRLTRYLDNFDNNKISQEFLNLFHTLAIDYKKYDNNFKEFDSKTLNDYFNAKPLILSYSAIDDYYHCAFRYYLKNILKVESFEESFVQKIGIVFHGVLAKCYQVNFDFEKTFNYYISQYELTPKEEFFFSILKEELRSNIEYLLNIYHKTEFKDLLLEEKIEIKIEGTILKGFIDKVMFTKIEGVNYAVVVDYKTGSKKMSLNNINDGLNLQLPIYMYLLKEKNIIDKVQFAGFYLQYIISKEDNIDSGFSHDDLLRLEGYSIMDHLVLAKLDPDYLYSSYIKGLRVKNDGTFYKYSKVFDEKKIEEILNITDIKVKEAINNIHNGDFKINPVLVNNSLIGCEYCNFQSICFKNSRNNRLIIEESKEEVESDV